MAHILRDHHGQVPSYDFGRVLLAGDAAHIPLASRRTGNEHGLRDATHLAWKLALIARGGAGMVSSTATAPSASGRRAAWKLTSTMTDLGTSSNPAVRWRAPSCSGWSVPLAHGQTGVGDGPERLDRVPAQLRSWVRRCRHGPRTGTHRPRRSTGSRARSPTASRRRWIAPGLSDYRACGSRPQRGGQDGRSDRRAHSRSCAPTGTSAVVAVATRGAVPQHIHEAALCGFFFFGFFFLFFCFYWGIADFGRLISATVVHPREELRKRA